MSYITLKHVFLGLMGISGITAFVVPARFVQAHVPNIEIFFSPVSRPSGAIAGWAHNRFSPERSSDTRAADVLTQENAALKNDVANLRVQLDDLKRIAEDHARY